MGKFPDNRSRPQGYTFAQHNWGPVTIRERSNDRPMDAWFSLSRYDFTEAGEHKREGRGFSEISPD
jgi:hypothetical protein